MITKKVKCLHCGDVLTCNESVCVGKCTCGKVSLNGTVITEGKQGTDWTDVSPTLLNG